MHPQNYAFLRPWVSPSRTSVPGNPASLNYHRHSTVSSTLLRYNSLYLATQSHSTSSTHPSYEKNFSHQSRLGPTLALPYPLQRDLQRV